MRLSRLFLILLTIILALVLYSPATAQDEGQGEPYYIVQEDDSHCEIAARFGIIVDDLQQANNISDPGQVVVGARLVIPRVSDVSGQLDTITISYGETLRSLSRRYGIPESSLARLNRLVSPAELYGGAGEPGGLASKVFPIEYDDKPKCLFTDKQKCASTYIMSFVKSSCIYYHRR